MKMTVIHTRSSGHVLAAFSAVADPERDPTPLLEQGLLVRNTKSIKPGVSPRGEELVIAALELEATVLDLVSDVLDTPRSFSVINGNLVRNVSEVTGVQFNASLQSSTQLTITLPTALLPETVIWIQAERIGNDGPRELRNGLLVVDALRPPATASPDPDGIIVNQPVRVMLGISSGSDDPPHASPLTFPGDYAIMVLVAGRSPVIVTREFPLSPGPIIAA